MMTWERFLKYISQVTVNENGIFQYLCVKIQVAGSLSFFFGMFIKTFLFYVLWRKNRVKGAIRFTVYIKVIL